MAERASPGFLRNLTAQEHRAFLRLGRRRRFRSGTVLFREGERWEQGVLAILSGWVKASYSTDEGQEILLAVRGPGELLGHLETIDGEPCSATGTTLGRWKR